MHQSGATVGILTIQLFTYSRYLTTKNLTAAQWLFEQLGKYYSSSQEGQLAAMVKVLLTLLMQLQSQPSSLQQHAWTAFISHHSALLKQHETWLPTALSAVQSQFIVTSSPSGLFGDLMKSFFSDNSAFTAPQMTAPVDSPVNVGMEDQVPVDEEVD